MPPLEMEGRPSSGGQNAAGHSVRGLLHDEYSEEVYLMDEVDDDRNGAG